MADTISGRSQNEADLLSFELSDEILEAAANLARHDATYTLAACTGLSVCPA